MVEDLLNFGIGLVLPGFVSGLLVECLDGLAVELIVSRVADVKVEKEEEESGEEKPPGMVSAHREGRSWVKRREV